MQPILIPALAGSVPMLLFSALVVLVAGSIWRAEWRDLNARGDSRLSHTSRPERYPCRRAGQDPEVQRP